MRITFFYNNISDNDVSSALKKATVINSRQYDRLVRPSTFKTDEIVVLVAGKIVRTNRRLTFREVI